MSNDLALPGHLFVCLACGKTSPNRYGFDDATGRNVAMAGWDESCMINCAMFRREDVAEWSAGGRVLAFKDGTKEVAVTKRSA